jgi:hypothetical protein
MLYENYVDMLYRGWLGQINKLVLYFTIDARLKEFYCLLGTWKT